MKQIVYILVVFLTTAIHASYVDAGLIVYALGDLDGGSSSVPNAINNAGTVVGRGQPALGQTSAILFNVLNGQPNTALGNRSARGISDSGQIVGYSSDSALLFDASGNGLNINLGADKRAYAINNNDIIVGGSGNGASTEAWLWDLQSSLTPLSLGSGEAVAVSDSGIVVGGSYAFGDSWRATLFDASGSGSNLNLGTLLPSDDRSFANGVNSSGQIVGYSGGPSKGYTATLYDATGNGNNLAIGAIGHSQARAINELGQVVGDENGKATLFDIAGGMNNIDLNELVALPAGWNLQYATAINDQGWITGVGNFGAFVIRQRHVAQMGTLEYP